MSTEEKSTAKRRRLDVGVGVGVGVYKDFKLPRLVSTLLKGHIR